jgi:hypothetical protein
MTHHNVQLYIRLYGMPALAYKVRDRRGLTYPQILPANHWKLGEHVSVLASLQMPETYVPITQNQWSQSCPPLPVNI